MQVKKAINPMDIHVGKKIRIKRKQNGYTGKDIAKIIGITSQQFSKYETGQNKISASRLYDVAIVLRTSIDYFFYGQDYVNDAKNNKQEVKFIKSLSKIKGKKFKDNVIHLVRSL